MSFSEYYTLVTLSIGGLVLWSMVFLAIQRVQSFTPREKMTATIVSAVLLFGYFFVALLVAGVFNFFAAEPNRFPRIPLGATVAIIIGIMVFRTPTFHKILNNMPITWLLAWVSIRLIGISFVVGYHQGKLPGIFAIPLGYGDVVFGVTAPVVAYWYAKQKTGYYPLAIIWSLLSVLDILVSGTIAVFNQSSPIQQVSFNAAIQGLDACKNLGPLCDVVSISRTVNQPNVDMVTVFPLVMNPIFGMPVLMTVEMFTLWYLFKATYLKQTAKNAKYFLA